MIERLTKKYPATGVITLDAEELGTNQETLDREVSASSILKKTVAALHEHEQRETSMPLIVNRIGDTLGRCPKCGHYTLVKDKPFYCEDCGQRLRGSNVEVKYRIYLSAGRVGIANIDTGETKTFFVHSDSEIEAAFDSLMRGMMYDWDNAQGGADEPAPAAENVSESAPTEPEGGNE